MGETKSRVLSIGDIHGNLKALEQVLERAEVTSDDLLIFLGDYVDGWNQSPQVLDYLMELRKTFKCIFIKGNHDCWLEMWLETGQPPATWERRGGQSTMDAYATGNYTAEQKKVHLDFIKSMPYYHVDDKNRLFVHGGFTNVKGVEYEYFKENVCWDRSLFDLAVEYDEYYSVSENPEEYDTNMPDRLKCYSKMFVGHTATLFWGFKTPMKMANVWNLDTGAGGGGTLTILDCDSEKFWRSDRVNELCPDDPQCDFDALVIAQISRKS